MRKHGISAPTYYQLEAKYGGLDVSQLRRPKELEAETAKLKKMYAELSLTMKRSRMQSKEKGCDPCGPPRAGNPHAPEEHRVPLRQACWMARLARSELYAPRPPTDDSAAIGAIGGHIELNPRHGFDKLYRAVRGRRLASEALKLNLKRRGKRRLPARVKAPFVVPVRPGPRRPHHLTHSSLALEASPPETRSAAASSTAGACDWDTPRRFQPRSTGSQA